MSERLIKVTVAVLLSINILNVLQAQTQQTNTSKTDQDLLLIEARRANEEAQATYYREQLAKLREPPTTKTFWQNAGENPASVVGVLGALISAFVLLFSLYKNQRLTIASQYDTQFYEALKRFGEKDSARLRSSAVGLLTAMAKNDSQDGKGLSKFSTVLNQLVAGSRLEENRVVLNTINDALTKFGSIDPLRAIEVLYKANLDLQNDLIAAMENYCFHFNEKDAAETYDRGGQGPLRISDEVWKTLEQVTGFYPFPLYDWFKYKTKNFKDFDESARAEINAMTAEERSKHKVSTLGQVKVTAHQLKQNVEVCCSTLNHLATRSKNSNGGASTGYSWNFAKLFLAQWSAPRSTDRTLLKLNEIFLVSANLSGLDLTSISETLSFQKAVLHGADLSSSTLTGAELSSARMIGTNLSRATMTGANLSQAILADANLEGSDLSNASLHDTRLWRARINHESVLQGARWWTANFFDAYTLIIAEPIEIPPSEEWEIDSDLVAELSKKFGPADRAVAHDSVLRALSIR